MANHLSVELITATKLTLTKLATTQLVTLLRLLFLLGNFYKATRKNIYPREQEGIIFYGENIGFLVILAKSI